jgi:glyoxylase-like metal-dependent hydrolase (beta-lactamase superfamily II)
MNIFRHCNDQGWFGWCDSLIRVFDEETGDAAAIDPVWPEEVLQAAQLSGAVVKMVLTTHHHW